MVGRRRRQKGGIVQRRRRQGTYNPYPDWYLDRGMRGQMGGGELAHSGKKALKEIDNVATLTYKNMSGFAKRYRKIRNGVKKKKRKTKKSATSQRGGRIQPVEYQYYQ